MTERVTLNIPLNRVEGDLDVRVDVAGGVVVDAWCAGTMYRGFERILAGRGALDGLVITPRICGICSTGHLTAAARALDMLAGATLPPNAVRARNVALMTEHVQSDVRQSVLMFAADFAHRGYHAHPLFEEAVRRYEPFKGESVVEVIRETKRVLEVVALIGGQWPHSSFMVPGGVVSAPGAGDWLQCGQIVNQYRHWYERRILGCTLERWADVRSAADLDAWLDERPDHRNGDLGFILRFARTAGLARLGRGHGRFISFGALDLPLDTQVRAPDGGERLVAAGFALGADVRPFSQQHIAEYVTHSWYLGDDYGRHPLQGDTRPYASGDEGERYSWSKAPRYDGHPAETGPLAEMLIGGHALIRDLLARDGPNVLLRVLARLIRPAILLPAMETWLQEAPTGGELYNPPGEIVAGEGYGLTQVTRGALGHWVRIENGRIAHYQIITPTAWNASPRDAAGTRGPIEEALIGAPVPDVDNPLAVEHVVRSFDPCLVCTVHALRR
jgi:Ni,Fe-hydrogenase I large subunit